MSTKTSSRTARRAARCGPDNWDAWSAHLATRPAPLAPWRVIPAAKPSPLRWGVQKGALPAETERPVAQLETWMRRPVVRPAQLAGSLESWLATAERRPAELGFALQCLGWSYLLPHVASILPAAPWCEVLDCLTTLAREPLDRDSPEQPLVRQLLGGELPLTLAYQFPELAECRKLNRVGRERLSAGIKALLDGDGLPHCEQLGLVRPLLACWTRCGYLARAAQAACFDGTAKTHFEWFVRQALQLTRQDGTGVFSDGAVTPGDDRLFDAALLLVDDEEDRAIADQILPWRGASRLRSQKQVFFPESAAHSEWAQLAVLRPDWIRGGQQLIVAFAGDTIRTELNCGSTTVWSGNWDARIVAGGALLRPVCDWQEVCWHSDDDLDYLELELDLTSDWRLQRQILLAREDRFLFAADALMGPEATRINYQSCLPLSSRIAFRPEPETREGYLLDRRRLGLVLPLALPEWRASRSEGSLTADDAGLHLRQTALASRLYAPLFIDLDGRRMRKQATWRPLTVGQSLAIQPPSVAAAYRVQVADDQWVFYRSLDETASRTFLGLNVNQEFFAGRFDEEGEADELIAIEPPE